MVLAGHVRIASEGLSVDSVPATVQNAIYLRTRAEAFSDPELYEQAAAEFDILEMPYAARACRERAKHYRETNREIQPEMER